MNTDYPLISVIVITYNSAQFVLETLNSVKEQIYQNIELIISDDGSKDETITICKEWVAENKSQFVNIQVISVEKNTGIPANCNRGLYAAKGEWIKIIAGDDVLLPNCISDNVSFVNSKKEAKIVQSNCDHYRNTFAEENFMANTQLEQYKFFGDDVPALEQHRMLIAKSRVVAPSMFINRKLLIDCGGFDDSLRYIEDYPLWLKFTKNGNKIYLLNSTTVKYRISVFSVNKQQKPFISLNYARELYNLHNKYLRHELRWSIGVRNRIGIRLYILLNKLGMNHDNIISKIMFRRVVPIIAGRKKLWKTTKN